MAASARRALGFLLLIVTASVPAVHAQPALELFPPGPPDETDFGRSVAMVGNFVAVGAARGRGSVYVFDRGTTAFVRKIVNPTPGPFGDAFGWSLAAVGTNLLVGAPTEDGPGIGAAYLFDPATGALLQSFHSPQSIALSTLCQYDFGIAVAAVGSNVLVGAPQDDAGGFNSAGEAYLFDATTGALLQTFFSPNPFSKFCGNFGLAVGAIGTDVLVSAPFDLYGPTTWRGAAYRFDAALGTSIAQYVPPTPSALGEGMGQTLTAVGGEVVVSGPSFDPSSVFVFAGGGGLLRTFTGGPPGLFVGSPGSLGWRVATAGSRVLITQTDDAVFMTDSSTGAFVRVLSNPTPPPDAGIDVFGASLSAVDGYVAVGSPNEEGTGPGPEHTGAVFLFYGGETPCGPCETAGPLGTCVVGPTPTCRPIADPEGTLLKITNVSDDGRDRLTWRWRGTVVHDTDFGLVVQPAHDSVLCVYDESGVTPSLLFRATVPSDACAGSTCWNPRRTYRNPDATPEGVKRVSLIVGNPPQRPNGKIRVSASGALLSSRPLGLPALPLPTPLRVQFQTRDGLCWESRHSAPSKNTESQFVAKGD
jgi:hypothetical protein